MTKVNRFDFESYPHESYMAESESGDFVRFEDYAALKAERDKLAAKGMDLCREAARVYEKYNVTQVPDMDLVDCQTIQEFSDLAGGSINTDAYANQLRAEGGAKALEDFADFNVKSIDPDSDEYTEVLMEVSRAARGFAANLRKENVHD